MKEKIDLRTDVEKERDARNERIVERYKVLRTQNPDASAQRICKAISNEIGLSMMTIKNIVKSMGVIKPTLTI